MRVCVNTDFTHITEVGVYLHAAFELILQASAGRCVLWQPLRSFWPADEGIEALQGCQYCGVIFNIHCDGQLWCCWQTGGFD